MVEFPEVRLNGELHSVVYYEKEDDTGSLVGNEGIPHIAGVTHEYSLQNVVYPPQRYYNRKLNVLGDWEQVFGHSCTWGKYELPLYTHYPRKCILLSNHLNR